MFHRAVELKYLDGTAIRLDKSIYSREVLLKTAYCFTDKAYLHLSQDSECWIVSWRAKEGCEVDVGAFENELITQELRAHLVEQTADVRKLILARAFASTILEEDVGVDGGADVSDPLAASGEGTEEEILKGWFDQHDPV